MTPQSDLLCREDAGALSLTAHSDDSFANFLLGATTDHSLGSDYSARLRSRSLDVSARADSIAWILKVNDYYQFQQLTAYLAVTYLDRFLSTHTLLEATGWAMQLLSVACLSLAAKIEETSVPSLLDLQVVVCENFIFESSTVCKMELLILAAFNWRLRSVTPFTFLDLLVCKVDPSGRYSDYLVSCASKIILETLHDIEFLDHCSLSVAASAMMCAVEDVPELAIVDHDSALGWHIGLTKEGIAKCYRLMQEVIMENKQRIDQVTNSTTDDNMKSSSSSSTCSDQSPNKRRKFS